jgi:hypothetical protein
LSVFTRRPPVRRKRMPWPTVLSRHLPFNSINRPCSELS